MRENTRSQAKTFRIQISLERETEIEVRWPRKYRTKQIAEKSQNEVAIELVKLGLINFKLKVV